MYPINLKNLYQTGWNGLSSAGEPKVKIAPINYSIGGNDQNWCN